MSINHDIARVKPAVFWFFLAGCAIVALCIPKLAPAEELKPIELGVVPNLTARVLLQKYQPLREYLERELKIPVRLSTAASWSEFDIRSKKNEYDIIITSANWARLIEVDRGYKVVGAWTPNLKGFIVHEKKRPLTNIADLRGNTLATSNSQSVVAQQGFRWLAERSLMPDKDFKTVSAANDESVGHLILRGEAIAAMCSNGEFKNIPDMVREQLDIFAEVADVSAFIILINPRVSRQMAEDIQSVFERFLSSEDGKRYSALNGVTGLLTPKDIDFKALDIYLPDTRRMSAANR